MKNITVSVDEETYRRARTEAARLGTSVPALVKNFLANMTLGKGETDRMHRQEWIIRERITNFTAGDRLSRDDVYVRSHPGS